MHILPQSEMFKRLQTTKSIFRPLGLCPGPLCIHCDTLKILITTRTSTVQTMTYSIQLFPCTPHCGFCTFKVHCCKLKTV